MSVALYYLGLACLFTHELDAVTHSEWRLLFVLRSLPSDTASGLFVALHVPLFFVVLWLGSLPRRSVRETARAIVAAFLVLHAVLHFSLSSHPAYTFHGVLSQTLILSAAACGAAYLVTRRRQLRFHS